MKRVALPVLVILAASANARASDTLPSDVVPLSSDELRSQMVDKTMARGGHERIYFSPDGSLKGAYDNTGAEALGEGHWTIAANEFCWTLKWTGRTENTDIECRKFYKGGSGIIVQQTKNYDGSALSVFPLSGGLVLMPGDTTAEKFSKVQAILHK